MKFHDTALPGVKIVEPTVFPDDRGYFHEIHHRDKFIDAGIDVTFVQDNHSHSTKGTIRGFHFQEPNAQGKLVRAVNGEILDVAVDIRRGSPHFGKWISQILSSENKLQMWVPAGFAHALCVLSETADVIYKCTDVYAPQDEHSIIWDDPDIGVDWPIAMPTLSAKDLAAPTLENSPILPEYS